MTALSSLIIVAVRIATFIRTYSRTPQHTRMHCPQIVKIIFLKLCDNFTIIKWLMDEVSCLREWLS